MATKARRKSRMVGIGAMPDRDWQAESDLDTLLQARRIRKDKKRFAAAQALARQRMEDAATISASDSDGDE